MDGGGAGGDILTARWPMSPMTDSIVDGDEVDGQRLTEHTELRMNDNPSGAQAHAPAWAATRGAGRTSI